MGGDGYREGVSGYGKVYIRTLGKKKKEEDWPSGKKKKGGQKEEDEVFRDTLEGKKKGRRKNPCKKICSGSDLKKDSRNVGNGLQT